jgi:hypothetical protein
MVENFDINFWNVKKKIGKDKTFKTMNPLPYALDSPYQPIDKC